MDSAFDSMPGHSPEQTRRPGALCASSASNPSSLQCTW